MMLRNKDERKRRNDIKRGRSKDGIMPRTIRMCIFRVLGRRLLRKRLKKSF